MKIALIGTGQMGSAVERAALGRGHAIVARFNADYPFGTSDRRRLADADVGIDFSLPDLGVAHIEHAVGLGLPLVVGTTGWYDRLPSVEALVATAGGSVLYASNFSLGVALLSRALQSIMPLLDHIEELDVYIHEVHHTRKVDSPSGTGMTLAKQVVEGLRRKDRIETETVHGQIDARALHVSSTRAGDIFGRHIVGVDGPFDEIALEHRAKSRDGFGMGAIRAAEWLTGRTGLFSFDDVLDEWMAEH